MVSTTHRWRPPHTRYDMLRHELNALLKRIVWRCSNRALSRAISRWRVAALRQDDADLRRALGAAGIDLSVLRERHNTLETHASSLSSRVDAFVQKARCHRRNYRRCFSILLFFVVCSITPTVSGNGRRDPSL